MSDWSFFLFDTPLNTDSGTGQITELTAANGRKLTFSLTEGADFSFAMPGSHWQTPLVRPGLTDVIAFRDDRPMQRFHVLQRTMAKQGGVVSCSYQAVSYRALLEKWLIHDGATRDFSQVEQTAIAWTLISQAEARAGEQWNLARGIEPDTSVLRDRLPGPDGDPSHGFDAGTAVGDAVRDLSRVTNGFEYDIEPSAAAPQTALHFNAWNLGLRKQHDGEFSDLVLDDGGTMAEWTRIDSMADYGNVVRAQGRAPTGENTTGATGPVSWRPSPASTSPASPYGRWERAVSSEATTQTSLDAFAQGERDRLLDPAPEWSAVLRGGRWDPDALFVGDYARVVVSDLPDEDVDETMRVQKVDVTLSDEGVEVVSLALGRPPVDYVRFRQDLERRLARLERR